MPTPNAVTMTPHAAASASSVPHEDRPQRQHRPDRRERDHDAARHRRGDRVLSQEPHPVDDVAPHARQIEPAREPVGVGGGNVDPAHHERRERERAGIEQQGQRLGTVPEERHAPADPRLEGREHREDGPAQRQRAVRAHEPDRVRVRELAARHQVRERRVARRRPQQRQALDRERQQEDRPQLAHERHRGVHHAAADVGHDHDLLAVDPVDEARPRSGRTGSPAASAPSSPRRSRTRPSRRTRTAW